MTLWKPHVLACPKYPAKCSVPGESILSALHPVQCLFAEHLEQGIFCIRVIHDGHLCSEVVGQIEPLLRAARTDFFIVRAVHRLTQKIDDLGRKAEFRRVPRLPEGATMTNSANHSPRAGRLPDSRTHSPDSGGTPRAIGSERTNPPSRMKVAMVHGCTPTLKRLPSDSAEFLATPTNKASTCVSFPKGFLSLFTGQAPAPCSSTA
jgi:hypothetical protein